MSAEGNKRDSPGDRAAPDHVNSITRERRIKGEAESPLLHGLFNTRFAIELMGLRSIHLQCGKVLFGWPLD